MLERVNSTLRVMAIIVQVIRSNYYAIIMRNLLHTLHCPWVCVTIYYYNKKFCYVTKFDNNFIKVIRNVNFSRFISENEKEKKKKRQNELLISIYCIWSKTRNNLCCPYIIYSRRSLRIFFWGVALVGT